MQTNDRLTDVIKSASAKTQKDHISERIKRGIAEAKPKALAERIAILTHQRELAQYRPPRFWNAALKKELTETRAIERDNLSGGPMKLLLVLLIGGGVAGGYYLGHGSFAVPVTITRPEAENVEAEHQSD